LNTGRPHGRGALVVVHHMIDPRAHGIAPHEPSIEGLQQFGRRSQIRHPRIKPNVVGVWIENHWHPVVDGGYFPTLLHAGFLRVRVAAPSISGFGKSHLCLKREMVTFW
jgi:hypothetical protein